MQLDVLPWFASRVFGVVAYVAMGLEVVLGLASSTRLVEPRNLRAVAEAHLWLASVLVATLVGHAGVLLFDHATHFGALQIVVPFKSSYRPVAVGIGVIAAWVALLVVVSHGLRKSLGGGVFRWLHRATFVGFALATFHGLLSGTDRGSLALRAVYLGFTGVIAALVLLRIFRHVAPPARARGR